MSKQIRIKNKRITKDDFVAIGPKRSMASMFGDHSWEAMNRDQLLSIQRRVLSEFKEHFDTDAKFIVTITEAAKTQIERQLHGLPRGVCIQITTEFDALIRPGDYLFSNPSMRHTDYLHKLESALLAKFIKIRYYLEVLNRAPDSTEKALGNKHVHEKYIRNGKEKRVTEYRIMKKN